MNRSCFATLILLAAPLLVAQSAFDRQVFLVQSAGRVVVALVLGEGAGEADRASAYFGRDVGVVALEHVVEVLAPLAEVPADQPQLAEVS